MQGFWGRSITFPFAELGLSEKICRPELSVVCGGWRGPCLPKDLVRPEALCKGFLGRDSQALLVRGVGSLANSWTFLFLVRATFMLSFSPSAKWGMLLPTSSYFPGSPNLIFQSVIKKYLSSTYYITGPRPCVWDTPVINTDMLSALVALLVSTVFRSKIP